MPTFDTDRIFNESPKKVLIREYQNLKNDYTKRNAISYKMLYENKPLSFILENSRYIFSEPMKGYDFYKSFIENAVLPFHKIEDECLKIYEYVSENQEKMSNHQKNMYNELLESVSNRQNMMKNSINLYTTITENCESILPCYDLLYEYMKNNKSIDYDIIQEMMSDKDCLNIMDSVNIGMAIPELSSDLFTMLESSFIENPNDVDDYMLNSYTSNVLRRMMKDRYIRERVDSLQNMNLRHLIKGLGGVTGLDIVENALIENVDDNVRYKSVTESMSQLFDDHFTYESSEEKNDEEKALRLLCEKAVVDMELAFYLIDEQTSDIDDSSISSSIVEQICVESTEIEKIPQTIIGNIKILEERSECLKNQIISICEKYFSTDGGPSDIVAKSVGSAGQDTEVRAKKHDDYYVPTSDNSVTLKIDDSDKTDDEDDSDDNEYRKREEAKKRKTEKYSKMNIDDSIFESNDNDDKVMPPKKKGFFNKSKKQENDDKVMPPEKKNIFQRIQNKALDMNVKFKKRVAKGKRTFVDGKNAGKAVTKVPMNISTSVKKSVNEWEEMDDNRRKEYIIKPGFRKKYFKALKLCILHYGAFSINPVLNIVLAICHKASNTKNVRIRNELIRELKAEIKVTEEKIEDARSNGDNQQKYKLMRIKEKLDAEVTRISSNSKFV